MHVIVHCVQQGISVDQQRIEQNGRQLSDDECPLTENESDAVVPISVLFELCGGKGGLCTVQHGAAQYSAGAMECVVEPRTHHIMHIMNGRRAPHVSV